MRLLVPVLLALLGGAAGAEDLRAVVVEEDEAHAEVWVSMPPTVAPDSLEVQLAGRVVIVRARDTAGQVLRAAPLRLRGPVVEEGATAEWTGEWLAITLRKAGPTAAH